MPTKVQNKPTARTNPKVEKNNQCIKTTNPMLKRIPKRTTSTKVPMVDIDLDQVPVTPTISVDIDETQNKKKSLVSLKRSSFATNEVPEKRAKLIPSTKQTISTTVGKNINKKKPVTSRIIFVFVCNKEKEIFQVFF